jgi:hypothetical protein
VTSNLRCPLCRQGTLEIVLDGLIGEVYHPGFHVRGTPLPTRLVQAPYLACNVCELCVTLARLNFAVLAILSSEAHDRHQ